jgi:uncharacterized membrane protein YgdD (TMEM256/DUF423 family)
MELNAFAARWLAIGAALMLAGVVLGAFGAHVAAGRLAPRDLEVLHTAVSYHQLHALGLMIVACAGRGTDPGLLRVAARLLLAGIVLFSGSLYALALGAPRALGAVTPLGGLAFMAGWAAIAWHAWRVALRAGSDVAPRT